MSTNYLSQETEIKLIKQLSPYLANRNFVDIGAEMGEFARVMLEDGLIGILFEPLPRHYDTLKEIVSQYADAVLYQYAITDMDSEQIFHVATDIEGKELNYYHSLQKASAPGVFEHTISLDVKCRSLQSLSESNEIYSELGILKTDTEGNDLNVLRGLGDLRPELVICEYFTHGLYEGWNESDPMSIIQHMRNLGYQDFLATKRSGQLEFVGLNINLYQDKQWGNLFFFRDDLYAKTKLEIAKCILNNENEIQIKFQNIVSELDKKEEVIQQLKVNAESITKQLDILKRTCEARLELINRLDFDLKNCLKNQQ